MSLRTLHDVPAPAKINLFLRVVGRREDGYHLLQSVFALVDWADTLHLECRSDARLARHDLGPALPADDLCLRAAAALQSASGTTLGADISILKTVPWGAGLGGGSSDAASTLLALNRLWGLNWPRDRLAAIGLGLGADVPFFIGGHNAWVEGIGERLTPLSLTPACYAVIKPPVAIATRDIFGHALLRHQVDAAILAGSFEGAGSNAMPAAWEAGSPVDAAQVAALAGNDLQPAAEDRCPEVVQATRWLQARYGNSRMTGSGSAVFARVGTAESPTAPWPADELPHGWVGRLCRSLPQHPLAGWAA